MGSYHIWGFPDSIYILLGHEAKNKFFEEVYQKFGNRERYAKYLTLDPSTVREYHTGYSDKNKKKWVQYIPIKVLKKSKKFLSYKTIKLIENNILAYRPRAGSPIKNPILPIRECPALYRLLGHIFGDGSATKGKVPYYANTCKELREEFIRDLQIFGTIKCTNRKYAVPIVTFQKAITYILSHIFEISFVKKDRLPKRAFSAPIKCKRALLRALFDDEGTCSTNLAIKMNGAQLVKDIKNMLTGMNIFSGKITKTQNKSGKFAFSFRIYNKEFEKFEKAIGFTHPKKSENLEAAIRRRHRKQRYRPIEEFENTILSCLRKENRVRTINIANKINLTTNHTLSYLKRMEKKGKLRYLKEEKKYYVWSKV